MKLKRLIIILLLVFPLNLFSQGNLYLKAKIVADNNNFTEAIQYVKSYLIDFPDDKRATFLNAKLSIETKNYDEAINELKKLKETYHEDIPILIARANAGLGMKELAFVQLEKYLQSTDKYPEPVIIAYPEFQNLKQSLEWKKLWEKERYSKKEVLLNNAVYAIKSGKYEEANERLDELLSRYSRSDKGYYLKAKLLYQNKEYSKALSTVENAIELDPKVVDYQCLEANCLAKLGRSKKAVAKFNEILRDDSLSLPAYLGRAEAYLRSNDFENALKDIEYYRAYYPSDNQAQLLYAEISSKDGDFLSAISTYGKLIKSDPSEPDYFIGRANSYMATKTYKYAIKDYSMALDLDPKNIDVYKKKAQAHKLAGEMKKACAAWTHAAKFGDVESQDNLKKYCR
jgi:tetratricopeptide (TPR) repeat protein